MPAEPVPGGIGVQQQQQAGPSTAGAGRQHTVLRQAAAAIVKASGDIVSVTVEPVSGWH